MNCWVCADLGKVGTFKQAKAVASRLIGNFLKKDVFLPRWAKLMPARLFDSLPEFLKLLAIKDLGTPLPDVVISAGRQGVMVAIALKKRAKTIVLMDPKVNVCNFDAVVAPLHDNLSGNNVITTIGAIHEIDLNKLEFPQYLSVYKKPLIVLMLGGNSIHGIYTQELALQIARDIKGVININPQLHNATLLITPSRRTPKEWLKTFLSKLDGINFWCWDETTPNPYPDFLTEADAVIVCEDSISMASEACASGKPVVICKTGVTKKKFLKFYGELFNRGYAQPLSTKKQIVNTKRLFELDEVVEKLKKLITYKSE